MLSFKPTLGQTGSILKAILKLQKYDSINNHRILNLIGRNFFGKFIGMDRDNITERILPQFPPLYVSNMRRKTLILGQISDLKYVKSNTEVWEDVLIKNLRYNDIKVIKNGSKYRIKHELNIFVQVIFLSVMFLEFVLCIIIFYIGSFCRQNEKFVSLDI
jgi:hypothetical protein